MSTFVVTPIQHHYGQDLSTIVPTPPMVNNFKSIANKSYIFPFSPWEQNMVDEGFLSIASLS